jgi:hypothetical protein
MRRLFTGLSLGLLLALTTPSSTLRLSPAELHAAEFRFNLLTWEISHLPIKWLQWLAMVGSRYNDTPESRLDTVETYFDLVREANALRDQPADSATPDTDTADPERDLASIEQQIRSLRPRVEEVMEAAVSDVLRQEDISFNMGILLFPPVDFSLGRLPTMLIISPRDRIERVESVLLVGGITPRARDEIENNILRQEDMSALVSGIGGISTYPSIIAGGNLRGSLRLAGHEWLHQYLIFHPLGRGYHRSGNMASLNETAANIFGDELGDLVFTHLTGEEVPTPPGGNDAQACPDDRFCFQREMQHTRLRVDELLEQGDIERAEAFMEERRLIFVNNGHSIRKLNQAYFAFHGTYADSPASVSPIHQQLTDLRQASGSLADFIHTVAALSTYDEFLTILEQLSEDS